MTDTSWTISTKSNGDLFAKAHIGDINQINRGDVISFSFDLGKLNPRDLTVTDSYTVGNGTVEYWKNLTVESGATLTINGTLRVQSITNNGTIDNNGIFINRDPPANEVLDELIKYGGEYTTFEGLNGVDFFDIHIPSNINIDSLLVGIEPNSELQARDIIGVWGVVKNINDERTQALNQSRYRIDVLVLGEYGDYSDHADVENNLKA